MVDDNTFMLYSKNNIFQMTSILLVANRDSFLNVLDAKFAISGYEYMVKVPVCFLVC